MKRTHLIGTDGKMLCGRALVAGLHFVGTVQAFDRYFAVGEHCAACAKAITRAERHAAR